MLLFLFLPSSDLLGSAHHAPRRISPFSYPLQEAIIPRWVLEMCRIELVTTKYRSTRRPNPLLLEWRGAGRDGRDGRRNWHPRASLPTRAHCKSLGRISNWGLTLLGFNPRKLMRPKRDLDLVDPPITPLGSLYPCPVQAYSIPIRLSCCGTHFCLIFLSDRG
ncbi:hypothetical protein F5Y05DRAFT_309091 [Hypoxylon sp. FL0543]|nr:hypothetical protein F5Y05DRAFT_309091 [Hypoxylon sp. FL0543]